MFRSFAGREPESIAEDVSQLYHDAFEKSFSTLPFARPQRVEGYNGRDTDEGGWLKFVKAFDLVCRR